MLNGYFLSYCCLHRPQAAIKSIQKQRKLERSVQSTHSTLTQPVHFLQTDLRHPQQNFAVLFCSQFTLLSIALAFCFHQQSNFDKNC